MIYFSTGMVSKYKDCPGGCQEWVKLEDAEKLEKELAEALRIKETVREKLSENIDKLAVAEPSVIARMKKYKESREKYYHENKGLKKELAEVKEQRNHFLKYMQEAIEELYHCNEEFGKLLDDATCFQQMAVMEELKESGVNRG